jgi:transcriptional regulator with XRE-family HTH domain
MPKALDRVHFHTILTFRVEDPAYWGSGVDALDESSVEQRARATASAFGSLVRRRRKELQIRQAQLALATGVGRRFLIELESGKPSCQLGRSLLVAEALGLKPADILASDALAHETAPELPDLTEEEVHEPDDQSPRLF